jgi:hypothetical protein
MFGKPRKTEMAKRWKCELVPLPGHSLLERAPQTTTQDFQPRQVLRQFMKDSNMRVIKKTDPI